MRDTDSIYIPFDRNGNSYNRKNRMPLCFHDAYAAKTKGFDSDSLVEYAPVKHEYWIDRDEKTWCSGCGKSNKQYKPPFCPHCGAEMIGEQT